MRRITYWVLSTITALVLLFGYHTSTSGPTGAVASTEAPITRSGTGSGTSSGTSSGTGSGTGSGASSNNGSGSGSSSASAGRTVTGSVAQTRWGPVQVAVTVSGQKVTDVSVLRYPNGNGRDLEINNRALPILIQETIDAQSADIDMVSGATVTSDGYLRSLQSALDQASL